MHIYPTETAFVTTRRLRFLMGRAWVAAANRADSDAAKGGIIADMRCVVTVSAYAKEFTNVLFPLNNQVGMCWSVAE